ncbi:unnamed protein product [Acanthosepion pharaonis]|uniref:Uncharacterized protein n=1 Tax=Acanthosepion pharaonis TaxID=158019 RepID=A0A812CG08_ACAPH|nr:unnamed protein product [Sepia pharaonis]
MPDFFNAIFLFFFNCLFFSIYLSVSVISYLSLSFCIYLSIFVFSYLSISVLSYLSVSVLSYLSISVLSYLSQMPIMELKTKYFGTDYGVYSFEDYRGTFMPLRPKKVVTVLSTLVGEFRNRYISGISWYHWPQDAEETCVVHNFLPHRVVQPHQCLVCKKIIWNQGSSCVGE